MTAPFPRLAPNTTVDEPTDICTVNPARTHPWILTSADGIEFRTCRACRRQDFVEGDSWTVNRWVSADEKIEYP